MSKTIGAVKNRIALAAIASLNILRLAAASKDGEAVVIGGITYEIWTTPGRALGAGNIKVDLSGNLSSAAKASRIGTAADVFSDGETATIAGKVYTLQTVLTNVDGHVLIGADKATSLANLAAAINGGAGAGTAYAAATVAHTTVTATSNATTITVTAVAFGTSGNALGTTETGANFSWAAATLAGGVDPTAGETGTALVAAITGYIPSVVTASKLSANEVMVVAKHVGTAPIAVSETLSGANNGWAAAALFGGGNQPDGVPATSLVERTATAVEVALGVVRVQFPFPPRFVLAQVRSSVGAVKAWDGAITITGNRVDLTSSGGTNVAATDKVTVVVQN